MAISRIEIQGQVTRAQDFTTLKQNEDNKGMVDQSNFQRQFNQNVDTRLRQVQQSERTEKEAKKFDAKEKGNGSYAGDGGRGRGQEEKEKEKDGKVVLKGQASFDIKI